MVYNQEKYNTMKSAYDRMTQEQKQQTVDQYKDNTEYQQFAQDYAMWGYGKSGARTPTQEPSNPAPVGNNQQNQTPANGQNWGNGGGNQQSLQNQETSNPQGQPSIQDMQKHQFGYQTDENYRKQRDTQFAQQLYQSNPNTFDYNAVFNYVKSQAPQVSQGEISNTVKNIQRQWLQHSRIGAMGTASAEQIRNGLLNGQFSQSDLEILRTQNPEKYQEYLAHDEKMNAMSNAKHNAGLMNKLYNWESVKGEKTNQDLIMEAMEKFFGNINYNSKEIVDAYKEAINSSEIQKWNSKMLRTQKEMDEIDDDLDSLRDDLKRQYPWISKAQLNALVYDRSYKSMKRKNELHRDYIQARGEVQFLTDLAGKNLEADLKRVELQRAEFTDKYNALGFAKGILEFETPQQKRDAELDQIKKKYQLESELTDLSVKDPKQLRANLSNALKSYYENYGSLIMRSKDQVVDDILRYAKEKGVSVAQAMSENFIKPLQNKPQYRSLINKQTGYDPTSWQQKWRITQDGDGKVKIQMEWTGQIPKNFTRQQRVQSYSNWLSQANTLEDVGSIVSSFQDGAKWGQCGAFANDIAKAIGSNVHFGVKLSEKTNPTWSYTKSEVPQVGSFAIFNSKNYPANGHVGVVTKVNADGSFVMKSSNRKGDERLYTSTHAQGSALTFIVPKVENSSRSNYDPDLEEYYKKLQSWKTITKEDWKTIESKTTRNWFLGQARTYKQTKDQEITPFAKELIGQLQELKRMDSWDFKNVWLWGIPWTKWAYYKSLYDRILSSTALHNLIDLKWQGATFWALSNQELEFITNASTNLKLKLGYGDFMDIVDQMISKLNKGITTAWWNGGVDMNLSDQGGKNQTLFSDMMRK